MIKKTILTKFMLIALVPVFVFISCEEDFNTDKTGMIDDHNYLKSDPQPIVEAFTWKDRHGYYYVNDAKDQEVDGPCGGFATVAGVEAMCMLYFNQPTSKYDFDLSEAQIYSDCVGSPDGVGIDEALSFIQNYGIIDESCLDYDDGSEYEFPYFSQISPNCDISCQAEKVFIPGYEELECGDDFSTEDDLKKMIINKGPLVIRFYGHHYWTGFWSEENKTHAYLLIGWRTVNSVTEWQLVDSWPNYNTIRYVDYDLIDCFTDYPSMTMVCSIKAYINSSNTITAASNPPFRCVDEDEDGYYVWGFGRPKPAGSGEYDEQDGNDDDDSLGPLNLSSTGVYGACDTLPPDPIDPDDITVTAIGDYGVVTSMEPNKYYQITAYADGAQDYDWVVEEDATLLYDWGNSIYIKTTQDFMRTVIKVKALNDGGWSDYKYTYYYYYY